jgi:DNA/RNA endonuclease G (NUC1)
MPHSVPPAPPAPTGATPLVDVFISYARSDQPLAAALAETLADEGFEVWWDSDIYAGADWERLLMTTLTAAKAVVVLWTRRSVQWPWVLKEAQIALETGRLVPVLMEPCEVPALFAARQAAAMAGWNGRDAHPELERLLSGVAALAPPTRVESVRPGYDSGFLPTDAELALPALRGVAEEFRYLHFSVVMNPARRLAWLVAYNVAPRNDEVERSGLWQPDPALPRAFQPQNEHFAGTGFDRGHLVSPHLVSWGSTREAQIANRQSFFWTNLAPQHPSMNRRWWYCVEEWERALAAKHGRLTGFAGPVLRDDDPHHGAVEVTIGRLRLRQNFSVPQAFWKIVASCRTDGTLAVAAFYFDQAALLARRDAVVPTAASFASTVTHIESCTGLDFGQAMREAPTLAPTDV